MLLHGGVIEYLSAVDGDMSRIGLIDSIAEPQKCALTRAVCADHTIDTALRNIAVEVEKRFYFSKALRQFSRLYHALISFP
ncbi:hypothetical protein SDC9_161993 [bioreactor metagenome]|uniref:Uncharacterized protein n=1 Tax=bioreactor metagenome TaxID=1076179 RepID=A0A645FLX9_9ZZZZ